VEDYVYGAVISVSEKAVSAVSVEEVQRCVTDASHNRRLTFTLTPHLMSSMLLLDVNQTVSALLYRA
jgi:hypothetical protein